MDFYLFCISKIKLIFYFLYILSILKNETKSFLHCIVSKNMKYFHFNIPSLPFLLVSILIILNCNLNNFLNIQPIAQNGILDLSEVELKNKEPFKLLGEWKFYWMKTVEPDTELLGQNPIISKQPSPWNQLTGNGMGYGTYELIIKVPKKEQELALKILYINSTYKLYINKLLIREVGRYSETLEEEIQDLKPDITRFKQNSSGEIHILLQVSNYASYRGGITSTIKFGSYDKMRDDKENSIAQDLVIFGSLVFIGFYHLGFYLFRKRDSSTIFFSFFCIAMGIRILLTGESGFIYTKFQFMDWVQWIKMNFGSLYCILLFFTLFLKRTFFMEFPKVFFLPISITLSILIIMVPFVKVYTLGMMINFTYIIIVLILLNSIYTIIKAIINKRIGASLYLIGFFMLSTTAINDLLNDMRFINTGLYLPIGTLFFVISYAFTISMRFSIAYNQVEELSRNTLEQSNLLEEQNSLLESKNFQITELNSAYEKFVPKEILNILNKGSITNFNLGDHTEKVMTIMFSDIRSFSSLSESMAPEENFEFINGFLKRIGPKIREHSGFIDKYIGDAIMALFPEKPEDAIDAAIAMMIELEIYNQFRKDKGRIPISIGIGINTGKSILGIVGEENRMNGTVISDAVNLASRLESLTKYYNSSILISDQTYKKLEKYDTYEYRILDTVKVRGKKEIVSIIEILNGNTDEYIDLKLKTKENFEFGQILFGAADFNNSIKFFKKVIEVDPSDTAADLYLNRSEYYKIHGAPPNWVGIVELQNK